MKTFLKLVLIGFILVSINLVFLLSWMGMLRVVLTGSMKPTINPGDVVLLRPPLGEIRPGMVVTYQIERRPITHRVVQVGDGYLVTRGDNNEKEDPWQVPVSKVIGIVLISVPYLGYVFEFIRKPLGLMLVIIMPALVFLLLESRNLVRSLRSEGNGRR